mmetsp:Transcript_69039/g.131617  ORF Transcript_69039/g.131617 Transcript_69039/m.131617 type:complete len:257 (-) Transcript_69039:47-817(-)
MNMSSVAVMMACLACPAYGGRTSMTPQKMRGSSLRVRDNSQKVAAPDPLEGLMALLAVHGNPTAAWQASMPSTHRQPMAVRSVSHRMSLNDALDEEMRHGINSNLVSRRAALTSGLLAALAFSRPSEAAVIPGEKDFPKLTEKRAEPITNPYILDLLEKSKAARVETKQMVKDMANAKVNYLEDTKLVRYQGENDLFPVSRAFTQGQIQQLQKQTGGKVKCPSWGGPCEFIPPNVAKTAVEDSIIRKDQSQPMTPR